MITQKQICYRIIYLLVSGTLAFTLSIAGCSPNVTVPPIATTDSITVYTGHEDSYIKAYLESFKSQYPDITVNIVRAASPILIARLLAEKDNPQADVVWGTAATNLMILDSQGMLTPYAPEGLDRVNKSLRDSKNPPAWVGTHASESVFCVNTVELKKNNLPMPESWYDLSKPIYKGFVVMPDPNASGTGFMAVYGPLQAFAQGKDFTKAPVATDSTASDINALTSFTMDGKAVIKDLAGWNYLDALDKNIASYVSSGTAPCRMAGTGETVIGISSGTAGVALAANGDPIVTVFPREGSGWEAEGNALIKKATIKDASKKFLDWAISDTVMKEYAKHYFLTSVATGDPSPDGFLKEPLKQYLPKDFYWNVVNRDAILKEWTTRYGVRAPK